MEQSPISNAADLIICRLENSGVLSDIAELCNMLVDDNDDDMAHELQLNANDVLDLLKHIKLTR